MHPRTFNPMFWALANLGSRVRYIPQIAESLTTTTLPAETALTIPTRHGPRRAVLVRPAASRVATGEPLPPVVVQLHGGGFLNRYPEQDRHIARFLAAELGAAVVLPDYSTAPKARYPVAEEEMYDVVRWVQAFGAANDWNGERLLLSGVSAGAKLAINVCQQIHRQGGTRPLAVSLVVPVTDMTIADRTSSIPRPAISPFVQRLVAWSYVPDAARRREPLASPRFDPFLPDAMPPTIIQTGEYDTLGPEGAELARVLANAGIETVHHRYEHADHGFYSEKPLERVRTMLTEITMFFAAHLGADTGRIR